MTPMHGPMRCAIVSAIRTGSSPANTSSSFQAGWSARATSRACASSPKYVAILFSDHETFLNYVAEFYPEQGEFGHPGGLYIPDGLGHFVLPGDPIATIESVIIHGSSRCEQSVWVNSHVEEHRAYWNDERLKQFWSGKSFKSIDGQDLSYALADFLLNALPGEPEQLAEFVNNASWKDAGRRGAREFLGIEIEALIVPLVPTLAGRFAASEEDLPQ